MARRGSYAKGIAKREEILATALEVIAREGYRGASVRELADAAGLSQAGLLHYFDSKDELFTEILRKRDEVDQATLLTDAPDDPLRAFVDLMRRNAAVPGLVELYSRLAVEAADPAHPAHAFFAERRARMYDLFTELFEQRRSRGLPTPDFDGEHLGLILISLADGLQTVWLQDRTTDMGGEIERALIGLRLLPATESP